MAQLVTRIDDGLVDLVDRLVADGVVESRSEAVRRGLHMLIDQHRRQRTAVAIVDGYRRQPQSFADGGWSDAATVEMISEEPW